MRDSGVPPSGGATGLSDSIGTWQGVDFEECLAEAEGSRSTLSDPRGEPALEGSSFGVGSKTSEALRIAQEAHASAVLVGAMHPVAMTRRLAGTMEPNNEDEL